MQAIFFSSREWKGEKAKNETSTINGSQPASRPVTGGRGGEKLRQLTVLLELTATEHTSVCMRCKQVRLKYYNQSVTGPSETKE